MKCYKVYGKMLLICLLTALTFYSFNTVTAAAVKISLISDTSPGLAELHGFNKLKTALSEKGVSYEEISDAQVAKGDFLIIAGIADGTGAAAGLLRSLSVFDTKEPESLMIKHTKYKGVETLLVAGTDGRGLMYALLDIANRIGWSDDSDNPLSEVHDIIEEPDVKDRALSKYTMHKSTFESFFFDEGYWARYLDMLADNRFNRFVLIFGYENAGYFAPPYPYFFDTDEFPDIRVVGITGEKKERNLKMLNRLIDMTHNRGLEFTIGIWDHIYKGGVQGPDEFAKNPTQGLVWGLTEENLLPFTKVALAKFLLLVPDIDSIQFRMHGESGLRAGGMKDYWENVYAVIREYGRGIRIDARAKNFPDDLLFSALDSGINMRLCTKYSAEQMGLPFHPTHLARHNQFDRREGYADLLRYPRRYKMHWRLWNSGTSRVLLWGDPEYVRRFAKSTHLYDGEGFEVTQPLATKMQAQPHENQPFDLLNPEYRYYDWEFERYWHFFQVFGRIAYNPETTPDIWKIEFEHRFGKDAAPFIERGIHLASRVLPRIIGYRIHRFPTTVGWVELQRGDDLPDYAQYIPEDTNSRFFIGNGASEPSDTQQFLSIDAAARLLYEGKDSAKIWPEQTSGWFADISEDILETVDKAEQLIDNKSNKEFVSTIVDLKILANLALYHSRRIHAGINWALYTHSNDLSAFDKAIHHESMAIKAWEKIVAAAGDVYHENLMMGRERYELTGHWRDELVKLKDGIDKLRNQRKNVHPEHRRIVGQYDFGNGPVKDGFIRVRRRSDFSVDIPNGHYELKFSIDNNGSNSAEYGPMWIEANGREITDIFTVPAGIKVEKTLETTVADNILNVVFRSTSYSDWGISTMTVIQTGPFIAHAPIRKTLPGKDIIVSATVSGRDSVYNVNVVYGSDKQGYRSVHMKKTGAYIYRAVIPGSDVFDELNYFIEATDESGRRSTFPSDNYEHFIAVKVTADNAPPMLIHTPVTSAPAETPLKIRAEINDPSGVKWVNLRYRSITQYQDFNTLKMLPTGKNGWYEAVIPGKDIVPTWDFMYLIEVMDNVGNGKIYPDMEKETPYVIVKLKR